MSSSALDHEVVIDVEEPMRQVCAALLPLLRGLAPEDWDRATVHERRSVKDLVAHLLHGSLRRVSAMRDGYMPPIGPIRSIQDLTDFIQRDNREFMTGVARLSPAILIELCERYDAELLRCFAAVDLHDDGLPVAWAGDERSPWWFDIAREYTEKWHHQQQVREAVGAPALYEPALYEPVLQTFARGLPFALREQNAAASTRVTLTTTGALSLTWTLVRQDKGWTLHAGDDDNDASTTLRVPAELLWKPWTKGLSTAEAKAEPHVRFSGDEAIVDALLDFVAIMA